MSDSDRFDPFASTSPHKDFDQRMHDPDRMRRAKPQNLQGTFHDPMQGHHKTPGKTVRSD